MHALLRILGITAWCLCVLVLVYQAGSWIITASWPTLTLMDVSTDLFGLDLLSIIKSLPIQTAFKTIYILLTTDLSIAMWWAGVFFFGLSFVSKVIFDK